jgi:hypothetical protein
MRCLSNNFTRFPLDAEQTLRFFCVSLRGLDQGIPSDPSRHGRSWSLRNPEAGRLADDQTKTLIKEA